MVHRYNQIAILRVTLINIMEYLILSGINIPVEGFPPFVNFSVWSRNHTLNVTGLLQSI